MKHKHLTVPFEMKQTGEDDNFYTFSGYGSTFGNVDHGGDMVLKGAFAKSIDKADKLPVLWQHNSQEPLGIFTKLEEDSNGLYVEGKMPKDDSFVRDRVFPQMKIGSIGKMSIGYMVKESEWNGNVRELKELELVEISLVTFPMNPKAGITSVKSAVPFQDLPLADRDMEWDSAEAMLRVRELTESQDEPSEDYKNAFLWYDAENSELFGSYKLPIADVVDGQLMAVPRGIFAAAAAMAGARGGVDIPDDDRDAVISNINRYYDKLGMDSPFDGEKIDKTLVESSVKNIRDAEMLLKSAGFSQSASKAMISIIKSHAEQDTKDENKKAFIKGLASLNK